MKISDLLAAIADLFLISDDASAHWIEVPALRRLWRMFFGVAILVPVHSFIGVVFARDTLQSSESATFYYRVIGLGLITILQFIHIFTTAEYFRFILDRKKNIIFANVLYFYAMSLTLFGFIYRNVWLTWPNMFIYINPPIHYSPFLTYDSIGNWRTMIEFMVLSALQTVNGSFYKIQFNGIIPSVIAWIQGVYTLCLITLLIASYVNQKTAQL